jgi:hypothetical protein
MEEPRHVSCARAAGRHLTPAASPRVSQVAAKFTFLQAVIMIEMTIQVFATRFFLALFLGALIGLECEWRQRMAGTRANAMVAGGAAAFAMYGCLISGGATVVSWQLLPESGVHPLCEVAAAEET